MPIAGRKAGKRDSLYQHTGSTNDGPPEIPRFLPLFPPREERAGERSVLVHRMEEREMHTALGMCEPDALAPRHRARCGNGSRLDRVSPRTDTRSITMAIRS